MTGVLDAASEAFYTDPANTVWTYFQDADVPSTFYVAPRPAFSVLNGLPQFHLTEYVGGAGAYLSALGQLTTVLAVPADVATAVGVALQRKGVPSPSYQAMPYIDIPNGRADPNQAFLNYADTNGTVSRTVATTPSLSGSQNATFDIDYLGRTEAAFLKAYFGGGGAAAGTVQVVYQLTVWARLGAVCAHVHFDAQAAYTYQRTFKWVS